VFDRVPKTLARDIHLAGSEQGNRIEVVLKSKEPLDQLLGAFYRGDAPSDLVEVVRRVEELVVDALPML
jgi:hypothetical protein